MSFYFSPSLSLIVALRFSFFRLKDLWYYQVFNSGAWPYLYSLLEIFSYRVFHVQVIPLVDSIAKPLFLGRLRLQP